MDRRTLRAQLQHRYDAALAGALRGAPALPDWMRPALPDAIAESLLDAAELCGELPEKLAAHYLERAPQEWAAQRARVAGDGRRGDPRAADPVLALLWRPLSREEQPMLAAALDGVRKFLLARALDPELLLGGLSLDARPSALAWAQGALLAGGLPLLGAGEVERGFLARRLDALLEPPGATAGEAGAAARGRKAGAPEDSAIGALIDRHLGQHLLHERLHGRWQLGDPGDAGAQAEIDNPGVNHWDTNHLAPPWMVREAAALWLQARAFPRHIFPAVAGEAVPGVSLFVLAGELFAEALGERALLSALLEPSRFAARIGARAAAALAAAEWQEWLPRRDAPFARDALRAEAWGKLAFAARSGDEALRASGEGARLLALLLRAEELGPLAAARELPSLLDAAERVAWFALAEAPGRAERLDAEGLEEERAASPDADAGRARVAVRAMFQENAIAEIFVTRPAPLADGKLRLDTAGCRLESARRPRGVFGEPARWIFPPAICMHMHARGLRQLELSEVSPEQAESLAAALVALARDRRPLDAALSLRAAELLARAERG